MQLLVFLLLISVLLLEFLAGKSGSAARVIGFIPELLSGIALVVIISKVVINKQIFIHPKYIFIFVLFVLLIVCGVILNSVSAGAIVAGIRNYMKFIPFFLLPAVYIFSDNQIKKQLLFLLSIALLQIPLSLYQRFIQFPHKMTGDFVTGSLSISSILSMFLISCIAVLVALYLTKRIKLVALIGLTLLLIVPTTINETKGTAIFLPIALFVPVFICWYRGQLSKKSLIAIPIVGVALMTVFLSFYYQPEQHREQSLIDFVAEGKIKDYLYKGSTGETPNERVGKADSIILAFQYLSKDLTKLLLGLGIGNVAPSFSESFAGKYSNKYAHLGPNKTSAALLIWEVGIFGLIIVVIGCSFAFFDSYAVSKESSLMGSIALSWTAISIIFVLGLTYKSIITFNVTLYLFAYFSGLIAAHRVRMTSSPKTKSISDIPVNIGHKLRTE